MPIPKKIYKHRLSSFREAQRIDMPVGTEILSTEYDGIYFQMWVLSTPYMLPTGDNPPMEIREFFIMATGTEFTIDEGDILTFIATVPSKDNDLHLFELKKTTINL